MSASVVTIASVEQFDVILSQEKRVVVDFTAGRYAHRQRSVSALTTLAERYASAVTVVQVDVEAFPSLAERYAVKTLPAVVLVEDRQSTSHPPAVLGSSPSRLTQCVTSFAARVK